MKKINHYEIYIKSTEYKDRLQQVTAIDRESVQRIYSYIDLLNGRKNSSARYDIVYIVVCYIDNKTGLMSTTYNVKDSMTSHGVYVHGYNNLPKEIQNARITNIISLI